MISFAPLWDLMKVRSVTTYTLQKKGVSSSTIRRLKAGESVSTHTLDTLCRILECDLGEIAVYIPEAQRGAPLHCSTPVNRSE